MNPLLVALAAAVLIIVTLVLTHRLTLKDAHGTLDKLIDLLIHRTTAAAAPVGFDIPAPKPTVQLAGLPLAFATTKAMESKVSPGEASKQSHCVGQAFAPFTSYDVGVALAYALSQIAASASWQDNGSAGVHIGVTTAGEPIVADGEGGATVQAGPPASAAK